MKDMAQTFYSISLDRPSLTRMSSGALKSSIDAHGPVTLENRGGAAKRVASTIFADLRERFSRQLIRRCSNCVYWRHREGLFPNQMSEEDPDLRLVYLGEEKLYRLDVPGFGSGPKEAT